MGRVGLFRLTPRPRLPIQSRRMFSPCSLAKGGCRLGRVQDVSNPWFALGNDSIQAVGIGDTPRILRA